ncbi:hypothetical protein [Caldiplasma sukawensis]
MEKTEMRILDYLNAELVITTNYEYPIDTFQRNVGFMIPSMLITNKDNIGSLYYFNEKMMKWDREVEMFLSRYKAMNFSGNYTLYANNKIYPDFSFFRKLIAIKSVVNYANYIWAGKHHFHFAFNYKYLPEISNLLLDIEPESTIVVEKMIRENRVMETINTINKQIRVKKIIFEAKAPSFELKVDRNPVSDSWERIIKIRSREDRLESLYLNTGKPNNVIEPIEPNVYEYTTNNEFLYFLLNRQNGIIIPTFFMIEKLDNDILLNEVYLPEIFGVNFIRRVGAYSNIENKDWDIILKEIDYIK